MYVITKKNQKNVSMYNLRSNKNLSKQNEYKELKSPVTMISDLEEINVEEALNNTHWRSAMEDE